MNSLKKWWIYITKYSINTFLLASYLLRAFWFTLQNILLIPKIKIDTVDNTLIFTLQNILLIPALEKFAKRLIGYLHYKIFY